jgi:DNA helicase-2/ATP-dependent DNA helicase PcrA
MTLFCVGDEDQMLYSFTGAKPGLLTSDLDNWLPNIETIKLEVNYRSTDEIIEASQKLIAHNYSDLGGPYSQEFMKSTSGVNGKGETIQFDMYDNAGQEAFETANQINELLENGYKSGDFFIGVRTRAQLAYVEGALVRAGIKFINITGGSFWQSKHVADVVAYLRLAHNGDKEALKRVNNIASNKMVKRNGEYCSTRYLGKKFLEAIGYDIQKVDTVYRAGKYGWKRNDSSKKLSSGQYDLIQFVKNVKGVLSYSTNVSHTIKFIIENCYDKFLRHDSIADDGLANAKLEDLATVEELAGRYNDVDKFLAYVDEMVQMSKDNKDKNWKDYVVISTYHRLKGLERPVVFGLGWCEGINEETGQDVGLLPHTFSLVSPPNFGVLPSGDKSPIEDERCIAFVCISRAAKCVYLSGIKSYRNYTMWPSRFIKEIK